MKKYSLIILLLSAFVFVSCNDFLDTVPDKRTELDSPEKIAQLLVTAYPNEMPTMLYELMSDNVTDNGPTYGLRYSEQTIMQAYKYENITEIDWDVPQKVWQSAYAAISSANQALEAIEKIGNPEESRGIKAEALLCRAFGHFVLANTFCIAYNPQSSSTDLGIPYALAPETTVKPNYDRGTVERVYEFINTDIEEALPLLDDRFKQPAYHFNSRAAYAFAAQFNLFYGKWEKVVEYATKSIGENPTLQFRNTIHIATFPLVMDRMYAYIDKDAPCNLLIIPQRSIWGRIYNIKSEYARYGHSRSKTEETFWQYFPWRNVANGYGSAFGSNQNIYFPKCNEIFEMMNATALTGQPHTVMIPYTVEETLMCRAEANAMLNKFAAAATDFNYWYAYYSPNGSTYSADQISDYYSIARNRSPRYPMDSRFGISAGMQENLVRAALGVKRLETVHAGRRWLDIRRHGITVEHPVYTSTTEYEMLTLKPYESRTAIQLPQDVIIGGIPGNPNDNIQRADPSLADDNIMQSE